MEIKSLTLKNFKGIKNLHIDFKQETNIFGANEKGKTTLFDAFLYVFTGKDSQGKADFDIKTTDQNGSVIHNLEHCATAVIVEAGAETEFKKVYTEKWTRKRGDVEKGLTGHTTDHFIDGVPVQKKGYDQKVSSLINEKLFKLLTDARYFNEQMHWTERRMILTELCGDLDESQIEGYSLIKMFLGERTIEEQKKVVAAQKKEINDQKEKIPPKIDENHSYITDDVKPLGILQQGKPREEQDRYRREITAMKNDPGNQTRRQRIAEIDTDILNKQNSFNADRSKKLLPISEMIDAKETKIIRMRTSIDNLFREKIDVKKQIEMLSNGRSLLLTKWAEIDGSTVQIKSHCPTCKQSIPENEIQSAQEEFNLQKSKSLDEITIEGKELNKRKCEWEGQFSDLESDIKEKEEKIPVWRRDIHNLEADKEKINSVIIDNSELRNEKEGLLAAIKDVIPVDTSELESKIQVIDDEIQEEKELLLRVKNNEQYKTRISELEKEESELSQQYANLEKQLFQIEDFIVQKSAYVESVVNKMFKIAKFKMFETQVNGGINDICETLKGGVPYNSVNNAGKIQVGIDIINTLQKFYGCRFPIWIDNRESITEIPDTDCQTISLYVSPDDETLRVE